MVMIKLRAIYKKIFPLIIMIFCSLHCGEGVYIIFENIDKPDTPPSITASDGLFTTRVEIAGYAVKFADTYNVYRSDASDGEYLLIGNTEEVEFNDADVAFETLYYYRVNAVNKFGESGFSESDSGYAGTGRPLPPQSVAASDGTFIDSVGITGFTVAEADSYDIYRCDTEFGVYALVDNTAGTQYDDTTVTAETIYYYKVKAINTYGESAFSNSDSGYADDGIPVAPSGVTASDGIFPNYVRITGYTVAGASSYDIYRSDTFAGTYTLIDNTSNSQYDDTTVVVETTYYYKVKAKSVHGESAFSNIDDGYPAINYGGVTFASLFGSSGTGDNQYNRPVGIVQDSADNFYFSDAYNHRIEKYDSSLGFLGWWGKDGSAGTGWHAPGTASSPAEGTGNGEMTVPFLIGIDSSDRIYVPNINYPALGIGTLYRNDIEIFNSSGTFLFKFGGPGTGDNQYYAPGCVTLDITGHIYVMDNGHHRIQKYEPFDGVNPPAFLGWFGSDTAGIDGTWHGPISGKTGVSGITNGAFLYANCVAVDEEGYLYVTDHDNNRVQKLYDNGTSISWVATWGGLAAGQDDTSFNRPQAVTVDNKGYVCYSAYTCFP